MSLYQKVNGEFVQMSEADEATARANTNNLFSNDSGFEIILSADEAEEIRAGWAAEDAVNAPKPGAKSNVVA
jgi:hypothetical protein